MPGPLPPQEDYYGSALHEQVATPQSRAQKSNPGYLQHIPEDTSQGLPTAGALQGGQGPQRGEAESPRIRVYGWVAAKRLPAAAIDPRAAAMQARWQLLSSVAPQLPQPAASVRMAPTAPGSPPAR
jgi:hypothetical protein